MKKTLSALAVAALVGLGVSGVATASSVPVDKVTAAVVAHEASINMPVASYFSTEAKNQSTAVKTAVAAKEASKMPDAYANANKDAGTSEQSITASLLKSALGYDEAVPAPALGLPEGDGYKGEEAGLGTTTVANGMFVNDRYVVGALLMNYGGVGVVAT